LPVLTRPRGSRKATLESLDAALKVLSASARDSELVFPKPGAAAASPESLEAAVDVARAGLKRPVHSLGVDHALGGGDVSLASPVFGCSVGRVETAEASCPDSGAEGGFCVASSATFFDTCFGSGAGFGVSLGIVFGRAGITGTAGRVALGVGFNAKGVASPAARFGCCLMEDGVVGFVESVVSEAG